jgi:hypothetical protein
MFVKTFQAFYFVVYTTSVEFYRYQNYETANHESDRKQDRQIRHSRGLRCLIKKRGRSNVTSHLPCALTLPLSLFKVIIFCHKTLKALHYKGCFNGAIVMSEGEGWRLSLK